MNDDRSYEWVSTRFGVFMMIEVVAVLIALVSPITPSKTGGDNDLAKYFIEDPTYLEKVFVAFVATNLLIAAIALVAYLCWLFSKRRETEG